MPTRYGEHTSFYLRHEAWFWFVQAYTARCDGAKVAQGVGMHNRPCEPVDILTALERLYRSRRIMMDHIRVLRHYGVRQIAPDPRYNREIRARKLWDEALVQLEEILTAKQIVVAAHWSTRVGGSHA